MEHNSKVYFASAGFRTYDPSETLPVKFEKIIDALALADTVKGKHTVIKMHLGREIGYTTIHPLFVRTLVEKLKSYGAIVCITDQIIQDARARGYTEEFLGCPIVEACGQMSQYFYPETCQYKTFTHVDIAGHIRDAEVLINLSHVKGHGACGYGGACKNIAMGCVTDRTRQQIHALEGGLVWSEDLCTHCESCITSCNHNANSFKEGKYEVFYHHCTVCQHCIKVCPTGAIVLDDSRFGDFQRGMALCTKTVLASFAPGHVCHINFLTNITALCDCWGLSTPSLVPDIGIMASYDMVALERACLDAVKVENLLVNGVPGCVPLQGEGHLFERLHGRNPFIQLDELEAAGLGRQTYVLEEV